MIASGVAWCAQLLHLPEFCTKTASRSLAAAATSFFLTIVLSPIFIRWLQAKKVGQSIQEFEGFLLAELHKKKKNTPTMGGLLIIVSVLLATIAWADWSTFFPWLLSASLLVFGSIGICDDWAKLQNRKWEGGISGKRRLLIQTLFAFVVIYVLSSPSTLTSLGFQIPGSPSWEDWLSRLYIPFKAEPLLIACGLSWIVIWGLQWLTMVGAANAVNLTDGLDGLAAGCTVVASLPFILLASMSHHTVLIPGSSEVAVCLAALCGACLGFLWFNSFPAQVFLGDTGSLAIGGMLGTAAVALHREWLLALVGAIFVVETISVMMQVVAFKLFGKRIFRCTPLHHHFEYGGVHEAKVVVRFWIVGLLLAVVGIVSMIMMHNII